MDENAAGATITAVSTENATETTVDNEHFEVVDGNLKLKADSSLDFEAIEGGMLDVVITASGDGESATHTVTITVNDVNEAPSIEVADGETPDGMAASSTVDENVEGAILGAITLSDPDAGQMHTLTTSDERFVTKQDAEGGWWLALADGVSLDHEAGATVMVTVTVTDDGDPAMSASTEVTITVNDVNEAPTVTGTVDAITGQSGKDLDPDPIDLLAVFSDQDEGDAPVRYEMSDAPDWLTFSVQYGEDKDGNDTVHGMVMGKAPTTGADSDSAHKVTLTATDGDGEEASTSFYVIIDDGNDIITDVDLLDNNGNVTVEYEVDENDASGVVFGEIKVHDQDHPMHPNGMHLIQVLRGATTSESPSASEDSRFEVKYDDAGLPWLALKEGMSLDEEKEKGSIELTIRVVDLNGDRYASGPDKGDFIGNVEHQTVTIVINDQNDAPKAGTIGNWWVTAEPRQRSEEVAEASWLEFFLELPGDGKPAFTDPDGDTLTYSLSGPSILQIDERSGKITNTKGGVPVEGVHRLTVTATDPDGESASASFYLSIALSGDGDDDSANDDNAAPRFPTTPEEVDYRENSGNQRVATFRVSDDDNDLGHHPFALDSVVITSIESNVPNDPMNVMLVDHDDDANTPMVLRTSNGDTGYGAAFVLSDPMPSGNTWTYHVYVRDTVPGRTDPTALLDAEYRDTDAATDLISITITVEATDGVADADEDTPGIQGVPEEIRIRIVDVNEAPEAAGIGDDPATPTVTENNFNIADGGTFEVSQSEDMKQILYINLQDIWSDPDDRDEPVDFGASVSGSWIKILHGPDEWGEIEGVTWGDNTIGDTDTPNREAVIVGGTGAPESGEHVVIIEIDRTGRNNGQDDEGSFTLTATDGRGATGTKTYKITPDDLNLAPSNAVTLSGSAREDATLRVSFNDDRDPDLAGSATPALVVYQWFRGTAEDGTGATLVRQSTSNSYTPIQTDVGNYITVKVKYYEVFEGELVWLNVDEVDNEATTSRMVTNTPDKGTGSITILVDADVLSVTTENVGVTDGDFLTAGNAVADTALSYSWEVSDNGRGGWEEVNQGADDDTSTLELDDGKGKYYRAVVTYDGDGEDGTGTEMESVYSDPIRVSNVRDATATAPAITGNAFPGGTLSIDVPNTSVQWQVSRGGNWVDIPGATGNLTLTQDHAGLTIRALVSKHSTSSTNPGLEWVVAVPVGTGPIPGGTTGNATPVKVDDYEIEASVAAPGHGPDLNGSAEGAAAGHNLSLTHMVDLASLFQDPDSSRLTFTVTDTGGGVGADSNSANSARDGTYVYDEADGGVLVFEIQGSTGKLTFNSDVYRAHDGAGGTDTTNDGAGNVLTLTVTATDEGDRTGTADVSLRINVAPTGINFYSQADGSGTAANVIEVDEHVGSDDAGRDGMFIARVDVLDENLAGSNGPPPVRGHKFGIHDVEISGDDRFMITHTGYTSDPKSRDSDGDGSTWEVRLKPGAKLDYETQADMNVMLPGKQIVLTLTATDGGGLSTPAPVPGRVQPITLTITLVDDTTANDRNHPPARTPNDVPGLKDDDNVDDNEVVDGDDDDTDGGFPPPPPGMSIGLIEDFVDNVNGFDQDLLEDFMLIIDDGIDIA